ncbi:tRNA 2-selenouridine(34) synthase MnmH [Endozoicomonas sp. GU-1]|uniref:tRNA 2-selenouridine(34) synthase MnmH n=1 Tax=Endozoicomonas sp. GU-1 TaxID=3009078 RepID=UPI0022B5E4A0|nr:tRNA 2-selenouridine(34) synthase MnmH [Endozoicomonas sp. GU-1]WBA80367.1 tRNA 2-selenouridine(34) synthase MnmH [Endozoicomonas sp. GU-1]
MTTSANQERANTEDFLSIFLQDIPLMDVRAPVEFAKGSFPLAINIPILDNHQRELIGTCYKEEGPEAAVTLGYRLATDDIRAQRLEAWQSLIRQQPAGYLFCFRGGQRSHITQQWLKESGYPYPLIKGGYKALRRFLIDELERSIDEIPFIILSGKTGTGKTWLIQQLPYSIDLEGLANHRGSSFGRRYGGQPGQIDFENRLSIALLKHRHRHPGMPVLLEDESKLIGRCSLPQTMRDKMQQSPLILLEETMEERVRIGLKEYVTDNLAEFIAAYGEPQGFEQFVEGLSGSLYRIRRRLGGERYQQLTNILENAIAQHRSGGGIAGYSPLISDLLSNYYDPMYDYQLEHKEGKVIFRGDREAIEHYYNKSLIN